jgi:hypothetical protein
VRPTAALAALMESIMELFDADWCALVDQAAERVVMKTTPAPTIPWLLEVASTNGAAPPNDRPGAAGVSGFAVLTRPVEELGLTVCVGRPIQFRRRERREIEMLVRVTDRTCRSARIDRIPTHWTTKGGVFGT